MGVGRAALSGFLEDGLPLERTSIIYNAVDPERLLEGDTTALRTALGVRPGDLVLTAVGSLIARKGLDVLIEALARTRTAAPGIQVRLLLVGEGPERENLQAVARSLGVSEIVHFLGTRTDVGAILRGATDIALSAARAEALPLNVLEAGFFGLPMIVSDIPPHREIVEHGRTGLVVPVDDPARFAEALLDLLQSAERRQALGCLARQNVHSSFLIERYVRAVLEPLQSSGRQARPGLRMDSRRRLAAGLHGVDPPVCAVACVGGSFPGDRSGPRQRQRAYE